MSLTIYEAAGGRQAFIALAHAWHARCLADPIVSHAFSHGCHPKHSERLAAYWAEALDDAGLPNDPRLRAAMKAYFRWATQAMSAYPDSDQKVPVGLALGRWSWDGPVV